jgi:anti-sigma factor RsiW
MARPANDDRAPVRRAVSDDDLSAYAAGRLGGERAAEVEGFLACNPDLAAQMMGQLHRGHRAEPARRSRPRAVAAAALGACFLSGLLGWSVAGERDADGWREADGGSPPDYVEDAAESRQATLVRLAMRSQPETPHLDADEVRTALKLRVPRFPASWQVQDAQVFPTDDGPAVHLVMQDDAQRRITLFVVRAGKSAQTGPTLAVKATDVLAFWQAGESAYVLGGEGSREQLLRDAHTLADPDTRA